ncbi:MAG: PAS domain-containing protein [Sulfurimonas sp.]
MIEHDSSYNPIVIALDTKGSVIDANESFLELVKYKREEIIKKNFFKNFIPGDIEKLSEHLQAIQKNEPHHQHFVSSLKGKEEHLYRIQWQVSTMKTGEHTYIIAVGSNISKYVEENCELKKEITSIKVGFEFFPMAVGYMDGKGDFVTMNPKFLNLLKVPKSKKHINFKEIPFLNKHIDFEEMSEYVDLIKEMHYSFKEGKKKFRVDIRMLHNSKKHTKLYIFVIQKL